VFGFEVVTRKKATEKERDSALDSSFFPVRKKDKGIKQYYVPLFDQILRTTIDTNISFFIFEGIAYLLAEILLHD